MNALSRRTEDALRNHRLLSHIKNSNPSHFVRLIHSHIATNLCNHPEKTNVAELLSGSLLLAQEPKTPSQTNLGRKFKFQKKKSPKGGSTVFGVPLTDDIVRRIYPLIRYLNTTDCQKRVGLFRKSGSAAKQMELREMLNRGGNIETQLDACHFNPHDVACVLKLFLRLLPEPLLTERHIRAYYLVSGMTSVSDRTELLQLMMLLLPLENVTLLRHLLDLLHRTSEEKDNLMDRNALAIVIAPNLFTLHNLSTAQVQVMMTAASISIVTFMIEKANVIFNIPEKLMQDVKNYVEVEAQALDVPMKGGKAADGDRIRRKKSDSDSAAIAMNHERCLTWESTRQSSPPLHAHMERRLDSMSSISLHSNVVAGRAGEDEVFSKPFDPLTPVRPTTQKKRTRSLGETLRNIFQRCRSVVRGSPPRLHLAAQPVEPVDSYISKADNDLQVLSVVSVTLVDSDDSDLCCQTQNSPEHGDGEIDEPSSKMSQPSLSWVDLVDVASQSSHELFSSSSSSDDVLPSSPNSLDATTSQATERISPVSATSSQHTPSAAKYRLRKIHPLYHWHAKTGLRIDRRIGLQASVKGQRPWPTVSMALASEDSNSKQSVLFEPQFLEVANSEMDNSVSGISLDDYKDDSEWVEVEPTGAERQRD